MPWVYLLIASMFESCWIYSLKFLDMKQIFGVKVNALLHSAVAWKPFLPLGGYIVFGLCNIYLFSISMKTIPPPTAFAVWMALALIFSKLLDVFVFHEAYNYQQILFTGVLLIGVTGLKFYGKA